MRHQAVLVAVCLGLAAASCSGVDGSSSTTTTPVSPESTTVPMPTTTVAPSTTTEPTDATTTTVFPGVFAPPQPFVAPVPTVRGGGSGCSPGPGPLPDGVWFGYIDGMTEDSIDFDLACFVSCEVGVGHAIRNDNPAGRTVDVADGAVVVFENPDGDDWLDTFDAFRGYDEGGLHDDVWIYINDGAITHIVEPAVERGCRSSAVDVEWTNVLRTAAGVTFNDLGLLAVANDGSGDNRFYWRSEDWTSWDTITGHAATGWEGWTTAGSGDAVAVGATISRWSGSSWSSHSFDALGDGVHILDMSEERALMAGTSGDQAQVYVLTRSGSDWVSETIAIGSVNQWQTWSGAISGTTFAIADTGMDTADGRGTVHVYDFDGTAWARTGTIRDPWATGDWSGNWGSSLDIEGDLLVVGADGATPGAGTPGAVYAYLRTSDGWDAELVGEGGEGFGFGARIDGDTIVAGAAHGDRASTFWIFTIADGPWLGTPIQVPIDGVEDWVYGIDVDGDLVAVSMQQGLWIGRISPVG